MPPHVKDLDLDPRLAARLQELGYGELWPSQAEAAPLAAAGKSLVLAVPTASGKSLIAYLALLNRALKGGKGLYLVPLRALASEKFHDMREIAQGLGLRVGISIGDYDDEEPRLQNYDVVVATSEKADALMRHRVPWLSNVQTVVADEVHLMNDPGRGPTMEVLLSRFRKINPDVQVVALSATIRNSEQLAKWLDAEHVSSEWRPVTLKEGVHFGRAIGWVKTSGQDIGDAHAGPQEVRSERDDPVQALTEDAVASGGQCLVFVNTRRSTEATAEKLATVVRPLLDAETKAILKEAAESLTSEEDATTTEARLAKCLRGGAAFHHAGLKNSDRALVERLFKEGRVKGLSATPTLAAGINLPARRVVVRDLHRYDANEGGNAPIPVLEYKQMAGRAGRPRYDKVGEAVTLAKSADQREEIRLSYIEAESERVLSKLGAENALRAHLLAAIAADYVRSDADLKDFIQRTFFAFQNDTFSILRQASSVVDFLIENDLVHVHGERYRATRFGKRVSELYIDPLSAVKLRRALAAATDPTRTRDTVTEFSYLHAVSAAPDMRPLFLRRSDGWLEGEAVERENELLFPPPGGFEYDWFLGELKTACLLRDWIEEVRSEDLQKKYQVYPGDVQTKRDTAEWLVSAAAELARAFQAEAKDALADAKERINRAALFGDADAKEHIDAAADALARAGTWLEGGRDAPSAASFETQRSRAGGGEFVTFAPASDPAGRPEPIVRGKSGDAPPAPGDDVAKLRERLDALEHRLAAYGDAARELDILGVRVHEGARRELLSLLRFRGVGRYRARQLWAAGYRGVDALKAASVTDLARVKGIGPGIAAAIKREFGDADGNGKNGESAQDAPAPAEPEAEPEPEPAADAGGQRSLADFGGGGGA